MGQGRLKTAVLGLDDKGQFLLKTAAKIEQFEIAAVADSDTNLVEKIAGQYKCAKYDDYRQLVTTMDSRLRENDKHCLLVAAGTHSCDEYIRMAMKKKFNVLKLTPMARNFEEAAEFAALAEQENIQFAVANLRRFGQSYPGFGDFLRDGRIEQVFLITAFCNFSEQPKDKWQTDPKLAGGGVLLHDCYEIIDQIILNFGIPQQIYCLNTNQAQDKQQRLYLVEDRAIVTMKFSDTLMGNLTAFQQKGTGAKEEFMRAYGKGPEQNEEEFTYDDDESSRMEKLLNNFALSILAPDENKLISSGKENLKNMAVIESAYLSARTAMPEEPNRILQMAGES
jgi:predicted dehydrogenase